MNALALRAHWAQVKCYLSSRSSFFFFILSSLGIFPFTDTITSLFLFLFCSATAVERFLFVFFIQKLLSTFELPLYCRTSALQWIYRKKNHLGGECAARAKMFDRMKFWKIFFVIQPKIKQRMERKNIGKKGIDRANFEPFCGIFYRLWNEYIHTHTQIHT